MMLTNPTTRQMYREFLLGCDLVLLQPGTKRARRLQRRSITRFGRVRWRRVALDLGGIAAALILFYLGLLCACLYVPR